MEITKVDVRKFDRENSRMKGIASVTLDGEFVVHDIRILEGDEGLFIAMPSKKKPDGKYKDIAHPITKEVRAIFEAAIFEAFENAEVAEIPETSETPEVEEQI